MCQSRILGNFSKERDSSTNGSGGQNCSGHHATCCGWRSRGAQIHLMGFGQGSYWGRKGANLILWVGFCAVLFLLLHLNEWYKLICYILSCPINTGILLIKVTCMFWGPQKSSNTYVHIHTYVHTPIDLPLAGLKQIEYFHHLSLPSIIDWNVSFKILIYYLILLPAVFVDLKPNFYIGNIIWHS